MGFKGNSFFCLGQMLPDGNGLKWVNLKGKPNNNGELQFF